MRVGLIAMSGVRVVNERLLEAKVTLPQFVRRGEVIAQLPSLALTLLAASISSKVRQIPSTMEPLPGNRP